MKIDLHCHTKKIKKSEEETRNVPKELFAEKVALAEVKILAITNHNSFDIENYLELKESVKQYCEVLPGIEFDVIGNKIKSKGHLILICDPDKVNEFSDIVKNLTSNKNLDSFEIDTHTIVDNFKDLTVIYSAHYHKDHSLNIEDLDDFEEYLGNKKNMFLREPSSMSSLGVIHSHNHKGIIGSDVIDWNDYENCHFGELKLDIKNFDSLVNLLIKNKVFIQDLINDNIKEDVTVYGNSKSKTDPFKIPVFDDVNIIFGDKGSGKTEIINSLEDYYQNQKVTKFCGGDKEKWKEQILESKDEEFDLLRIETTSNFSKEISFINNYKDSLPTPLNDYYKYQKYGNLNKNKTKFLCKDSKNFMNYDFESTNEMLAFIEKIDNFKNELSKINISDDITNDIGNITKSLENLKLKVNEEYKKKWIEEHAKYLVDKFISKINRFLSDNTGTPEKPSTCGLFNFINNRLALKSNCSKILSTLRTKEKIYNEKIGDLGEKGTVYLKIKYCFLNDLNYSEIKTNTLKIKNIKTNLKNIVDNYKKIEEKISDENLSNYIKAIKETSNEIKFVSIDKFISISKCFVINNKEYNPSKGELAILSLQYDLLDKEDEYNVFLIDEPEVNLSSLYINNVIIPLLIKLSNKKKKIIIATHDANIAIRTRPYNSILKIVDNHVYKTYVGNMYTDELKNIDDGEILSWKDESIKYLEGGKEAFDERGDLYE